mmetsp:Transcript_21213/g.50459  ORF Transcript_21213/g.50459 Transcript_21213/m.50459 type:complete len:245 (-) Transcript_21213:983-1717(-)
MVGHVPLQKVLHHHPRAGQEAFPIHIKRIIAVRTLLACIGFARAQHPFAGASFGSGPHGENHSVAILEGCLGQTHGRWNFGRHLQLLEEALLRAPKQTQQQGPPPAGAFSPLGCWCRAAAVPARIALSTIQVGAEGQPKALPEGSCRVILLRCLLVQLHPADGEIHTVKGQGLAGQHTLRLHAHGDKLHSTQAAPLHCLLEICKLTVWQAWSPQTESVHVGHVLHLCCSCRRRVEHPGPAAGSL